MSDDRPAAEKSSTARSTSKRSRRPRKRSERAAGARRDDADAGMRPRRVLAGGAGTLVVGLGLVGLGESDVGMVLVLVGLAAMIVAVHTLGRLGPDPGRLRTN